MNDILKTAGRSGNAGSIYSETFESYVSLPAMTNKSTFSINLHTYSIEFLRNNSPTGIGFLMSGFFNTPLNSITLRATGDVRLFYEYPNYETSISTFNHFLTWNSYTLVYDGINLIYYVNSEEAVRVETIQTPVPFDLILDKWGSGYHIKGNKSHVTCFNRVLNTNEIKLLSQGLPISRTDLVGEWKLNEMSGTTAYDTSGNGNHGTIVGATYSTDKPF